MTFFNLQFNLYLHWRVINDFFVLHLKDNTLSENQKSTFRIKAPSFTTMKSQESLNREINFSA